MNKIFQPLKQAYIPETAADNKQEAHRPWRFASEQTWPLPKVPEVAHALSTPRGRSWGYSSSMGSGFWDTGRFSKLPYLCMKLIVGQSPRICTYMYTLLPQGVEIEVIFGCMGNGFWDTGQFSKLPYLGMKPAHCPKSHKLHPSSRSVSRGRNWAYFCSTGSGVRDTGQFSKLPNLGMKLSHWPKYLAIGQSSRSCIYTIFLPQGGELRLIFALRAAVFAIQAYFQNCHIWAWNLVIGRSSRSCTYTLFLPHGVEIELIFGLRAAVSEIFKIAIFGHETHWPKCHKLHTCSFSTPGGRNWGYFALRAAVSEVSANFQNCHIWAWNLASGQSSRSCTYALFLPQGFEIELYFGSTGSGFRDMG